MAFQFTFESLLRLRRSEQRQQELTLQRMNAQVSRMRLELAHLEEEIRHVSNSTVTTGETNGAELQFEQQHLRVLAQRIVRANGELKRALDQQAFAAAEFNRTWQRREALESLQGHEREVFETEDNRKEQRRQDDIFLQRKAF